MTARDLLSVAPREEVLLERVSITLPFYLQASLGSWSGCKLQSDETEVMKQL